MSLQQFTIPVMGTAFTIDAPIKVAKFGITSVVSLCDDELCEEMRQHYSFQYQLPFTAIEKFSPDFRAKRISAYLNLIQDIVDSQIKEMKNSHFDHSEDLNKYFDILPTSSPLREEYFAMKSEEDPAKKEKLASRLKEAIVPGSIDVNIMTKLDRRPYDEKGQLMSEEFSDALAALRGFAQSKLRSSIEFSAGFNRRLYAYIEAFDSFFPDENGDLQKKIILKVSDYRSSLTQGRFLAKKGVWVTEHRIESGLNCGGHAFASGGYLMGPILEEFKQSREQLQQEQLALCNEALAKKNKPLFAKAPPLLISVQGGIGTAQEQNFLLDHYAIDRTGWGSPFLLAPDVTLLDDMTRLHLANANPVDFYLSGISPLGVPFNTVKGTLSEVHKMARFEKGKPGSHCPKGYLVSNEEFSKKPVCTASSFYQKRKIASLRSLNLSVTALKEAILQVVDKACLCEDLAAGALIKNKIDNKREQTTAICPGPNLGFFSKLTTLSEMAAHIYGRANIMTHPDRPHMFISELKMYINYLKKEITSSLPEPTEKQIKYFSEFRKNIMDGVLYYKTLIPKISQEGEKCREKMKNELASLQSDLESFLSQQPFSMPALV